MKKFLIEMKHGLGDCVCMIPMVKAIRDSYPDSYIVMLVNGPANREIFEHSGIRINEYHYISLKNRPKSELIKLTLKLRRQHFDYAIMATMTPAKKGKLFFKLISPCVALGEQYYNIPFFYFDNKKHFVNRNVDLVRPICKAVEDVQPHLYVNDDENSDLACILKSTGNNIAVNIGGADKNYFKGNYVYTRNWPSTFMCDLVNLLIKTGFHIYLLGGKLEESLLDLYDNILNHPRVHNFVNKTSVSESMLILKYSKLSVGVDTGMQHVADALSVPTLSIFGPTNPKTHGAFSSKATFVQLANKLKCQYCFDKEIYYTCNDRQCLNLITPHNVFECIVEKLSEFDLSLTPMKNSD